jgi:3-oxoacyl-[acyl-carrier protein] reductase
MKPVALITGLSSSVGSACAAVFSEAGFAVCGIDSEISESAQKLADVSGGTAFERDIRRFDAAQETVDWIVTRLGSLDALVLCSGMLHDFDEAVRAHLKPAFNFVSAAARHFKRQRHGKIVAIAPNDGRVAPHEFAVRSALLGFTRAAARELGRYNVNVNGVAPELYMVEAREIADLAQFLCSEESRHVTGEVLFLNGGMRL